MGAHHVKNVFMFMSKIISIEAAKRGTSQVKVETTKGDVFIIGFSSTAPVQDSTTYSSLLCSIMDDFGKMPEEDLFSYVSLQMARAKLESPLFLMPDRNGERTRIGKKIRSIREGKGMEAKMLARLTDIDPANLSRIESGKFSAGLDTLSKIATALDSKVDIIPNRTVTSKGFSMKRNIWVFPTGGYSPLRTIPGYGYIFWPVPFGSEIMIGDIVTFYESGSGCHFIVSDVNLRKGQLSHDLENDFPGPDENADCYIKLKYKSGISYTEEAIIQKHVSLIKEEPKEITLLEGDIL